MNTRSWMSRHVNSANGQSPITELRLPILVLLLPILLFSCYKEDPGPLQNGARDFAVVDFDRLEIGDAFDVTVVQGAVFSVNAKGDNRNLNDMRVDKSGSTLRIKFSNHQDRQYTTYVTITMPVIYGLNFSGAVNSRVTGFTTSISRFDASYSGASVGQVQLNAEEVYIWLSGASNGRLVGTGKKLEISVSGASELSSFDFLTESVSSVVSGSSVARVNASQQLNVTASGASEVIYRGNPQITADVSGASFLRKDQ